MITIYRLKLDKRSIVKSVGLKETHGVFGSPEWWQHIKEGTLPVHHLKGTISRVYMSGMGPMGDWPEFTLRTEEGKEISWFRYANDPDFGDAFYTVGRPIEIDYVIQWFKYDPRFAPDLKFMEIPIELRVGNEDEILKAGSPKEEHCG